MWAYKQKIGKLLKQSFPCLLALTGKGNLLLFLGQTAQEMSCLKCCSYRLDCHCDLEFHGQNFVVVLYSLVQEHKSQESDATNPRGRLEPVHNIDI